MREQFNSVWEFAEMEDGTYYKQLGGSVENYGVKWNYGYIVGTIPINEFPHSGSEMARAILANTIRDIPNNSLFGIWTDPTTGITYVDYVKHVDDYESAIALASDHDQIAIYSLRDSRVIEL